MLKAILKISIASLFAVCAVISGMWGAASAATMSPQAFAGAAFEAMGGDKRAELETLTVDATFQQWDRGESESVKDPLKR